MARARKAGLAETVRPSAADAAPAAATEARTGAPLSLPSCPFCGAAAWADVTLPFEGPADTHLYRVRCAADPCGARGPIREMPEAARQAWAERVTLA